MNDAVRLARYARRYLFLLLVSVVLMAIMGAMTALRPLLIKPVLGEVLRPHQDAPPVPLYIVPHFNKAIYLQQFFPAGAHKFSPSSRSRFWSSFWCAESAIIWAITSPASLVSPP